MKNVLLQCVEAYRNHHLLGWWFGWILNAGKVFLPGRNIFDTLIHQTFVGMKVELEINGLGETSLSGSLRGTDLQLGRQSSPAGQPKAQLGLLEVQSHLPANNFHRN